MRSNITNGRNWHDDYYEPLWSLLEELELPIGFHESSSTAGRQIGDHFEPNFMLRRAVAQPMEQMLGWSVSVRVASWRVIPNFA